jgi:putative ABC transport system permease protein
MPFLLDLAWRDLRGSGRTLWVFCACLVLGVALVAAGGGLYRQVAGALQADVRATVRRRHRGAHDQPLGEAALAWMARARPRLAPGADAHDAAHGDGRSQLVELQSADAQYPLYGELRWRPPRRWPRRWRA